MTPKEKAKELVDKMLSKNPNRQDGISSIDFLQAKLCALITVDEIFNTNTLKNRNCGYIKLSESHIEFWEEIKHEIEKL